MSTPDDPYAGQPSPEHGQTPEQPPVTPAAQPPPGYYGQPPAPYYYAPAPPNPPSRVAWFAIGAASMFGLGVVGVIGFFTIVGLLLGDDFGDYEDGYEDGYYYVDQTSVVRAVEEPCATMRSAASDIQLFGDPKAAATDIKGFVIAAEGIVDAIDAHDPNADSRKWRDDWKSLNGDLTTYADDLSTKGPEAVFTSSTGIDDDPVMMRMSYSSDANCEVPQVIMALDRENADAYANY